MLKALRNPAVFTLLLLLLVGCSRPEPAAPPAATAETPQPVAGRLTAYFFDIGQGDAALLVFPGGKTMLIDGGGPQADDTLIAQLQRLGVNRLDWVVASHPHADHIGGLPTLLKKIPAALALDSGFNTGSPTQIRYLETLREIGAKVRVMKPGETIAPDGQTTVTALAPTRRLEGTESDPNNNSLVLRVDHGQIRMLFTGDMQKEQRQTLYDAGTDLRADLLKVAHHGSHDGTDPQFLRAVSPRIAVLSLGANNEYGHPHREVTEALQEAGVTSYRTDLAGTVTAVSDGRQLTVSAERQQPAEAPPSTNFQGAVVGNRNSKVMHAPDCPSLPGPERRVNLPSAAEGERQVYRPHGKCMNARN